ncbi:hypothetical protein [Roseibium salinum]|uniref:Uncharacterized protein n=1 Tax=Roseibium salinum TaxID=1604349 RepID=A0ABT3R639_9HYPH|nr:hypothetical protein [Roseibium sp. DSM 29163]MCX2724622.1 hypothetical protein [Roseibium sp. DSM 29163]
MTRRTFCSAEACSLAVRAKVFFDLDELGAAKARRQYGWKTAF